MYDPSLPEKPLSLKLNSNDSDSSISDDGRADIEHVLEHGSPIETMTPRDQRIHVVDGDLSRIPATNPSSWMNKIRSAGASMMDSMRPSSSDSHQSRPNRRGRPLKAKLLSTWNNIKYSSTWMMDRRDEYVGNEEIVMLGRRYLPNSNGGNGFHEFCTDYYSLIWFTYRTDFAPLLDMETTWDCGWGCMIRSTQMVTAHAILRNQLGRDWRLILKRSPTHPRQSEYAERSVRRKEKEMIILKLFEDKDSAPLGIHRLIRIAARENGIKAVGCWYTPSEAVFLMKTALFESTSHVLGDTVIVLSIDGRIHVGDVEIESKNWCKKVILVVVVRLGAAGINRIYFPHLKKLFSMETCIGITGGRPDHSSWFIGYCGEKVIYLDPHVAHRYEPIEKSFVEEEKNRGFHCNLLSKMDFSEMDPSCAICFRFETRQQFDEEMRILNLEQYIDIDKGEDGMKRVRDPLFCVVYGERRREEKYEESVGEEERAQADRQGFEFL